MSDDFLKEKYISEWTISAKQHFDDGDYEWLCDVIQQCFPNGSCKRILELGCGAGYSTLAFLLRDYHVVSIDYNNEAITHTDALIKEHNYTSKIKTTSDPNNNYTDVLLWENDILHELGQIKTWVGSQEQDNQINLIVLCNPGGNTSKELTQRELALLQWGGFGNDEISEQYYQPKGINLLHKWAILYGACELSQLINIPLMIVERDVDIEFEETLKQLACDVQMKMKNLVVRPIRQSPSGGTRLADASGRAGQLYWGAALFIPSDS